MPEPEPGSDPAAAVPIPPEPVIDQTAGESPVAEPAPGEPIEETAADPSDQGATIPPAPRPRRSQTLWTAVRAASRGRARAQFGRIALGALVGLLVLIALVALLPPTPNAGQAAPNAPAGATPTPAPQPAATTAATTGTATGRAVVREVAVLGGQAGLLAPQEAVQFRNGTIAVADTGHKRLVFLDARGHLLTQVTAGASPLQQPFAITAAGGTLYVLDSEGDTISRFDSRGRFRGTVLHDPVLNHARGLALGPHGTLLVANPASNGVLTLSRAGSILHTLGGSVGSGPTSLDQPSDVALGTSGFTYILDNNNQRVQIVNAAGAFVGQRRAPASSTIASAHVLPLPDGRLLVSDPTGSLLLYPSNGGSATRIMLRVKGDASAKVSPLGLALMKQGGVLVTDTAGNRLLVLTASQL